MPVQVRKPVRRASAGASGPIRTLFGPELIQRMDALCDRDRTDGPWDLARDYSIAAAAAAAALWVDSAPFTALCMLYIGLRQRQLSNLTHEAIHNKLTRSSKVNRLLGHLNTAALGEPFTPYKRSHAIHHAFLGSPQDPMLQSYIARRADSPWPDKTSFVIHVILANAVWTLPKYGVMTLVGKSSEESWRAAGARWTVWSAALAGAALAGHLLDFVLLWMLPLVAVRPIATWLTDLGNHAGLIHDDDPIRQTRGWTSHLLARHLLGGHNDDMYHPIHHWFPGIRWNRLPHAAEILREDFPRWHEVPWCSGYFRRRHSTPDTPCVLDDIIERLNHSPAQPR